MECSSVADSVVCQRVDRSSVSIDSVMRSLSLEFDTLSVCIERPAEVVRLRAVKGRITQSQCELRAAVEGYNRLDSVAYKNSSDVRSAVSSSSTGVYNPPDGNVAVVIAVFAVVLLLFLKKRS